MTYSGIELMSHTMKILTYFKVRYTCPDNHFMFMLERTIMEAIYISKIDRTVSRYAKDLHNLYRFEKKT